MTDRTQHDGDNARRDAALREALADRFRQVAPSPVPLGEILGDGRALRVHRQRKRIAAAAALLVPIAIGAVLLATGDSAGSAPAVPGPAAPARLPPRIRPAEPPTRVSSPTTVPTGSGDVATATPTESPAGASGTPPANTAAPPTPPATPTPGGAPGTP